MKILAIERQLPGISPEAFHEYLKPEAARLWELSQEGRIRELYFRQDRAEAVLMLECENAEEAHRLLASLPLVEEGLISFEVIPLRAYPGFSRLFASDEH